MQELLDLSVFPRIAFTLHLSCHGKPCLITLLYNILSPRSFSALIPEDALDPACVVQPLPETYPSRPKHPCTNIVIENALDSKRQRVLLCTPSIRSAITEHYQCMSTNRYKSMGKGL